jgi:hypothetical protein
MTRHCAVLILALTQILVASGAAGSAGSWRWRVARVDPAREHLELRFGSADEPRWTAWILVARVGRPVGSAFPVEFLLRPDDSRYEEAIAAVRDELDYYLVELGDADPWAYAMYHAKTMANLYSSVHWIGIPNGDWIAR